MAILGSCIRMPESSGMGNVRIVVDEIDGLSSACLPNIGHGVASTLLHYDSLAERAE
jgi:hypothetical protein